MGKGKKEKNEERKKENSERNETQILLTLTLKKMLIFEILMS